MLGDDDVGDNVARGGNDGDAALAELQVDVVVEGGREDVADEGGEENKGDDNVGEAVVGFELFRGVSVKSRILHLAWTGGLNVRRESKPVYEVSRYTNL